MNSEIDSSFDSSGPSGSESVKWSLGTMNPLTWQFLQEPAWKWAVFFIALSLFGAAWGGVIRYMK